MSEVVEVTDFDRLTSIVSANETVIVEFGAEWCGPCKRFYPHYVKFAEQNHDIVCVKVDVDSDEKFLSEFNIQSVPQVMLFKDGRYERHLEGRTVVQLNKELTSA